MANQSNKAFCEQLATNYADEDLFEKWLRRRLDYAIIAETGHHAPEGLLHTVMHAGNHGNDVIRLLRDEIGTRNQLPSFNHFGHKIKEFDFPEKVKETLNYRFSMDKYKFDCPRSLIGYRTTEPFPVSLHYLATKPWWGGVISETSCRRPHTLDTPLSWPLDDTDTNSQCLLRASSPREPCQYPGPCRSRQQ